MPSLPGPPDTAASASARRDGSLAGCTAVTGSGRSARVCQPITPPPTSSTVAAPIAPAPLSTCRRGGRGDCRTFTGHLPIPRDAGPPDGEVRFVLRSCREPGCRFGEPAYSSRRSGSPRVGPWCPGSCLGPCPGRARIALGAGYADRGHGRRRADRAVGGDHHLGAGRHSVPSGGTAAPDHTRSRDRGTSCDRSTSCDRTTSRDRTGPAAGRLHLARCSRVPHGPARVPRPESVRSPSAPPVHEGGTAVEIHSRSGRGRPAAVRNSLPWGTADEHARKRVRQGSRKPSLLSTSPENT
uniref:MarR family transcriptional regulator n=1 Tax=Streptomyces sp. SCSIO 1666 TaxID=861528 RepID=A0A291NMY8_9ACTN|nr:MarR family transcriptional regulator [Streptomyces sp. SCSIO 1666]